MRACIVIPHYDHIDQFREFLPSLVTLGLPLFVTDDASPADQYSELEVLLDGLACETSLNRHDNNQGKGGAVITGLRAALAAGFTHAVQIDADGQHNVADVPRVIALAREYPGSIVCGEPRFDASISRLRFHARHITLWFCWLETLGRDIRDALCGLRIYPLEPVIPLIDNGKPGRRMAFDPEILVRAVWAGIPLRYLPVSVRYPEGGRSHFHYLRDNLEISWMHTRLIAGMLLRLPSLIRRKWLFPKRKAAP